jgi:transposase
LTVFATHTLTAFERADFYTSIGLDARILNKEVIVNTIYTAISAFPPVLDTSHPEFFPETRDFISDCLVQWWEENKVHYCDLEELLIDHDGGSATRSNRKQFIKRIVQLVRKIGIKIRLIYYPPYHSKYNSIERCWAALENYWNGAIIDSVEAEVKWASNMRWKVILPKLLKPTPFPVQN